MVKVIGLTGSIASGKSTVTSYLLQHGYTVLDADEISRHALDIGTLCYNRVVSCFDVLNEDLSINRKKLSEIIFNNEDKKRLLESIIHPYVIDELKKGIQECQKELIFLDIPLLYEIQLDYLCDKVIVVYVNEQLQKERLMNRNHIDEKQAELLMSHQISIEIKKEKADYIIDNQGDLDHLYHEIDRVLKEVGHENIYE